jgi:hypothetical protein
MGAQLQPTHRSGQSKELLSGWDLLKENFQAPPPSPHGLIQQLSCPQQGANLSGHCWSIEQTEN